MKLNLKQLLILQELVDFCPWDKISFEDERHILKEIQEEIDKINIDQIAIGEI